MKPTQKDVNDTCWLIEEQRAMTRAIHQFNTGLRGLPPMSPVPEMPTGPDNRLRLLFRLKHIQEEMQEALDAVDSNDIVEMADAMADIVYLALGVCHDLKIPFEHVFAEIHRSNMTKERVKDASESKRNDPHDLKKGPTFSPADVKSVLQAHGARI